jgi:hypothetical protein
MYCQDEEFIRRLADAPQRCGTRVPARGSVAAPSPLRPSCPRLPEERNFLSLYPSHGAALRSLAKVPTASPCPKHSAACWRAAPSIHQSSYYLAPAKLLPCGLWPESETTAAGRQPCGARVESAAHKASRRSCKRNNRPRPPLFSFSQSQVNKTGSSLLRPRARSVRPWLSSREAPRPCPSSRYSS